MQESFAEDGWEGEVLYAAHGGEGNLRVEKPRRKKGTVWRDVEEGGGLPHGVRQNRQPTQAPFSPPQAGRKVLWFLSSKKGTPFDSFPWKRILIPSAALKNLECGVYASPYCSVYIASRDFSR